MESPMGIMDELVASMRRNRSMDNPVGIQGIVLAELRRKDGSLKSRSITHNLVTAVGDQYYAGRAALSSGLPSQVTGMKLGTGNTAPAKTGAGAALITYLTGSDKAMDGGFPTASAGTVTWQVTWGAGVITGSTPAEAVLCTDTLADSTSTAANSIARSLVTGLAAKGSSDILTIIWAHVLLGA